MISRFEIAVRVILLSIFAALCVCGDAKADGIMIPQVVVPNLPDMPSQRAIIKYRDGVETLIVESAFKGVGKEMAWILPVPSKPTEIAKAGTGLFATLEMNLLPPLGDPYKLLDFLGKKNKDTLKFLGRDPFRFLAIAAFLLLIWSCLFFFSKKCNHFILVPVFILLWFSIFVTSSLLAQRGPAPSPAPVSGVTASEIIPVGNYDVQVLEAVSPDALSEWLKANEFQNIPEAGKPVVADYIGKDWKFVVARLTRESDGLSKPHPLKLTFGTKTPVYPMRLTQLAGSDLYLDLYVIADQQATTAEMRANHVSIFKSEGDLTRYTTKLDGYSIRKQPSFFGSYDERLALPSLIDLMWDSCVMTRFKGVVPNKAMNRDFDIGFCNTTPIHERYIPKAAIFAAALLVASLILWIGTFVRRRKKSLRAKVFLTILFPLLALLEILLVHSIGSSLSIEIKMHNPDFPDVYLNILFHDPKHPEMEDVNVKSLEDAKRSYTLMTTGSKNPYTNKPFTFEEGPGEIVVTQEGESIMLTAYDKAGAPKKVRIK